MTLMANRSIGVNRTLPLAGLDTSDFVVRASGNVSGAVRRLGACWFHGLQRTDTIFLEPGDAGGRVNGGWSE